MRSLDRKGLEDTRRRPGYPSRSGSQFLGKEKSPEQVAAAAEAGEPFAEIHRRAMAGEFAPAQAPIDVPA
jgi:hypothetical protein